jgi:hypothetical protein
LTKHFENLDTLVSLTMDKTKRQTWRHKPLTTHNAMLIDTTEAEVFAALPNDFRPPHSYHLDPLIRNHNKASPDGSPFYTKQAFDAEIALAAYRQETLLSDHLIKS